MTVGLQIFNTNGVIQIDENLKNPRYVTGGSVAKGADNSGYGTFVINLGAFGIDLNAEIPLILVRPNEFGKYVGGIFLTKQYGTVFGGNFCMIVASDSGFDYAVFSTRVGGITDPGNFGLQVFNAAGEITYNSNNRHARIVANLIHTATPNFTYPYSYAFSGFNEMPWIVVNPLVASYLGEQDYPAGVYAKVNAVNSITIGLQLNGAASTPFLDTYGLVAAKNADPYNGKSASFALANWA